VLAYLFWHTPSATDTVRYEHGLGAFHTALAAAPPAGFVRSWTLRVERPAWLPPGPAHYLDWYLVESFTALGELNHAAISGRRRAPHDEVAALAGTGTAGLAGLVAGSAEVPREPVLGLFDKPPGEPYASLRATLVSAVAATPATGCWMRQMTLGPGPEFVASGGAGVLPSLTVAVTELPATVVATAGG
jgi:hypothetical protein